MRTLRARLSALLVTASASAPVAPALVLSARAGAADSGTAARAAVGGAGACLIGLRSCASSADDVARVGAATAGTRAASGLGGAGSSLDDAARLGVAGSALDDAGRAGTGLDDLGRAGSGLDDAVRAGDLLPHGVDALDLALAAGDDDGDAPASVGSAMPVALRAAPWLGRWTGEGGAELRLAAAADGRVTGSFTYGGRTRRVIGRVDASGGLEASCLDRDSSTALRGTLRADGAADMESFVTRLTLRRAR